MKPATFDRLRLLFRGLVTVHAYAVDPGAVAILREVAAAARKLGHEGSWFAEGWAADSMTEPFLPLERLAEVLANDPGPAALLLAPQMNFQRTQEVLRLCGEWNLRSIFVFDHWKNLAAHFVPAEGGEPVLPDDIVVPDEVARELLFEELRARALDPARVEDRVRVICQFAIEAACERIAALGSGQLEVLLGRLNPQRRPLILVALDPTARGEGEDLGYDDRSILAYLADYAPRHRPDARFLIKPHPRQDAGRVADAVSAWKARGIDCAVTDENIEWLIALADEVWGMTSVALLIAAEAGRPIKSFQVGRNLAGTRHSNPHLEPFVIA